VEWTKIRGGNFGGSLEEKHDATIPTTFLTSRFSCGCVVITTLMMHFAYSSTASELRSILRHGSVKVGKDASLSKFSMRGSSFACNFFAIYDVPLQRRLFPSSLRSLSFSVFCTQTFCLLRREGARDFGMIPCISLAGSTTSGVRVRSRFMGLGWRRECGICRALRSASFPFVKEVVDYVCRNISNDEEI
jgi:hypothetical protein